MTVNRNLNEIDSRINKDYSVDPRILELERVAEADYHRRKQIISQLEEEKARQQRYYETLQRIREQKEMLDATTRFDTDEQETYDYNRDPRSKMSFEPWTSGIVANDKSILIADQNQQPAGPKSQAWSADKLQSSQVGNFDVNKFHAGQLENVSKLQTSQVSNMGTTLRGSLNKNDDFNLHQMRRSVGNDEKIREFEYNIREKGNKFQQIGKHYQTWRPKRM